jgi:hypothetical protein
VAFSEVDKFHVQPRKQAVEVGRRDSGKSRHCHVLHFLRLPVAAKWFDPDFFEERQSPRGIDLIDCIIPDSSIFA